MLRSESQCRRGTNLDLVKVLIHMLTRRQPRRSHFWCAPAGDVSSGLVVGHCTNDGASENERICGESSCQLLWIQYVQCIIKYSMVTVYVQEVSHN